jgi:hypothetical protein
MVGNWILIIRQPSSPWNRNRIWNIDVLGVLRGRYLTPAFAVKLGETAIRNCLRDQLKAMMQEGLDKIGVTPCVFTEIGIPYDMDDKDAYKSGDFISQIRAMDANHFALEGAQAGFTLWVYTANNNHQWGDNWNGEDLSIYSVDDRDPKSSYANDKKIVEDVDQDNLKRVVSRETMSTDRSALQDDVQATRAAEAFVRPSPVYTNGIIIESGFDLAKVTFRLKLAADKATDEAWPTEMFMPPFHFPKAETEVEVSGGKWEYDDERNVLRWWHMEGEQEIKVKGVGRRKIWGEDEGYLEMFARNYGNLGQCVLM